MMLDKQTSRLGRSRHWWLGAGFGLFFWCGQSAIAADMVTLQFDQKEVSVPVALLKAFAESGDPDSPLQGFFKDLPPEAQLARSFLGQEFSVAALNDSRSLQSPLGQLALNRLADLFKLPLKSENFDRLRQAVVASHNDDQKISIIELLERYPSDTITLDLRAAERAYRDFQGLLKQGESLMRSIDDFLKSLGADKHL